MVLARYRKIFQAFNDLIDGLMRAQSFYSEMKDTVESLEKNVENFVSNRRAEGAQLLSQIERDKASVAVGQADRERDRLRGLMDRMSVKDASSSSPPRASSTRPPPLSRPSQYNDPYPSTKSPGLPTPNYSKPPPIPSITSPSAATSYQNYPQHHHQPFEPHPSEPQQHPSPYGGPNPDPYNPMAYPYQTPTSPPPSQMPAYYSTFQPHQPYPPQGQYLPQGYIPPPPPPGPPPGSQPMNFAISGAAYPSGPGGYAYHQQPSRQGSGSVPPSSQAQTQQAQNDPWAGLNAWK